MNSKSAEFLTTSEVAEILQVEPETVSDWRARGEGPPHYRVGRAIRYKRADLDAWLASNRVEPKGEAS